jgi:hypothetical protein
MAIAETIQNNSMFVPFDYSPFMWRVVDYMGGTFLIVFFLLSTYLNPIVFYHYWQLSSSIPNILYRFLSSSDFVTNLLRPIIMAVAHFSSAKYSSVTPDSNGFSNIVTVTLRMSATMSFAAVALLSLTRAMKIQWPFYHIKKRLIFIWLGVIFLFELVIVLWSFSGDKRIIKRFICIGASVSLRNVSSEDGIVSLQPGTLSQLSVVPMHLHAGIAAIVTIWAFVALTLTIKRSKVAKNCDPNSNQQKTTVRYILKKFKGCGAIIIMNLTSLIMSIFLLIHTVKRIKSELGSRRIDFCHSAYAVNMALPTLIAATNPVILMRFNKPLRDRVKFWTSVVRSQSQLTVSPLSRQNTVLLPVISSFARPSSSQ